MTSYELRYRPGTDLALLWGTGPTRAFDKYLEAEWVRSKCANGAYMEVVEVGGES